MLNINIIFSIPLNEKETFTTSSSMKDKQRSVTTTDQNSLGKYDRCTSKGSDFLSSLDRLQFDEFDPVQLI